MKFMILMFLCLTSYGKPTVDGLFRNVSNPDPRAGASFLFTVKNLSNNQKTHLRVSFGGNRVFVAEHRTVRRLPQDLVGGIEYRDIVTRSRRSDKTGLLLGLLGSLGVNSSVAIGSFLKSQSPDYRSNNEIVDTEKVKELDNYGKYLKLKEEDDEEAIKALDLTKVKKTLNAGLFRDTNQVQLFHESGRFFWKVKLSSFEALFNKKRKQLALVRDQKNSTFVRFKDYKPYEETFFQPSKIIVAIKGQAYEWSLESYRTKAIAERFGNKKLSPFAQTFFTQ